MKKIRDFLVHLFIPTEKNNFRAKSLHIDYLTTYLIFALFLTFFFKKFGYGFVNVLGFASDISIDKLYQLTNTERQTYNLVPLNYNGELAHAAYLKAQDMFAKNYWSHYSPDGKTPWDFILNSDYSYEYAGENLAKNFLFSQGVVDAWMNSPSHRENILRKEYNDVGFAVVNGVLNGEETTVVVQMFGKPRAKAISYQNPSSQAQNLKNNIEPTLIAKQPTSNYSKTLVLSKRTANKFNLSQLSFGTNVVFMIFLLLALITDFYFATKLKVFRITGKNIAHFIFISFILGGLIFLTRGIIL